MLGVHFLRQMNIGTLFFNFLFSTKLRFFMIANRPFSRPLSTSPVCKLWSGWISYNYSWCYLHVHTYRCMWTYNA